MFFWGEGFERKLKKKLKIVKEVEELMDLFNKSNFQLTNILSHYINFAIVFLARENQEKILSVFF